MDKIKELLKSIENDTADLKKLLEEVERERNAFIEDMHMLVAAAADERDWSHKDDDKI